MCSAASVLVYTDSLAGWIPCGRAGFVRDELRKPGKMKEHKWRSRSIKSYTENLPSRGVFVGGLGGCWLSGLKGNWGGGGRQDLTDNSGQQCWENIQKIMRIWVSCSCRADRGPAVLNASVVRICWSKPGQLQETRPSSPQNKEFNTLERILIDQGREAKHWPTVFRGTKQPWRHFHLHIAFQFYITRFGSTGWSQS